MWLKRFKAALALEEIETIGTLIQEMPSFDSLSEMEEAAYLLKRASELLQEQKDQTAQTLLQLKNTLDFLKSTETLSDPSLNIKL